MTSLIRLDNLSSASKVLEVGCGSGNYIGELKALTHCTGYGIDSSPEMLSIARAKSPLLHIIKGRAENLGFEQNFFDLVFTVDVIHQISDRRGYFEEAFRVLDGGGKVCTVTHSEWIIRNRTPLSLYFPSSVDVELRRYPKDGELKEIMKAVGFNDFSEEMVEYHYQVTDIESYRSKVYSSLLMIPQEDFEVGIERMVKDLAEGPIPGISRYSIISGVKKKSE